DPHLTRGALPFEPQMALIAGQDGLAAIRAILADACRCLKPGGFIASEHGYDQGPKLRNLFVQHGLSAVETHRDLLGHERVTLGYRP
ncbi:MAG: peptide chain release factor N(5)-glutamine methyltransferase, partial [Rhodocyclaceae bacterium]|nr:peptide chain release factor N(5)-glutamine methyltransferase [Rhodocyclaceae bacterium]